MKNIAFAIDPDGYWVEIISRPPGSPVHEQYNFSQTMLRIKSPAVSLPFYTGMLGMRLVRESHYDDFSLYFLACIPPDAEIPDPKVKPVLMAVVRLSAAVGVIDLSGQHEGQACPISVFRRVLRKRSWRFT